MTYHNNLINKSQINKQYIIYIRITIFFYSFLSQIQYIYILIRSFNFLRNYHKNITFLFLTLMLTFKKKIKFQDFLKTFFFILFIIYYIYIYISSFS